jgi:hypothetical protein
MLEMGWLSMTICDARDQLDLFSVVFYSELVT